MVISKPLSSLREMTAKMCTGVHKQVMATLSSLFYSCVRVALFMFAKKKLLKIKGISPWKSLKYENNYHFKESKFSKWDKFPL